MSEPLATDQTPVILENAQGDSDIVLVCEHAGRLLPEFIGSLGLDDDAMSSHIAWDIGIAGLARRLSALLDAPLVMQRYSRLVYDCNRAFDAADAIVVESDHVVVPGNQGLTDAARRKRFESVYLPFESAISHLFDQRQGRGLQSVLVTLHSFTPVYKGQRRDLELGVLHDADRRLADALLDGLQTETQLNVARNQPYSPADGATHTLITHGVNKQRLNVMFEVRNDLILDDESEQIWAERLYRLLSETLGRIRDAEIS